MLLKKVRFLVIVEMETINDNSNDSVQLPLDTSEIQSKYEPSELKHDIFNGDYSVMNGHIQDGEMRTRICHEC